MIAFARPNEYKLEKWQMCISEHDGTRVRCAVSEEDGIVVGGPSWSPDGKYVAFSVFVYSCPDGQCGQLGGYFSSVVLLDTRNMQITSVGTQPVTSVAWSPDGRKIAFAAFGTGSFGGGALYVMDPDGSNLQFLGQSMGPYSVVDIAWSPDGARLALALNNENACPWYCDTALGVVKTDGTGLQVLANAHTSFPGQAADRYITFPAWSTDGSRLAYTVIGDCYESEPGCPTEIRVWDASAGDSYVLVPNAASGSSRFA
jgi:Tol biopolymer transport system component